MAYLQQLFIVSYLESVWYKTKPKHVCFLYSECSIPAAMVDMALNWCLSQDKKDPLMNQLDQLSVLFSPRLPPLPASMKWTPSRLLTICCQRLCVSTLLQEIPANRRQLLLCDEALKQKSFKAIIGNKSYKPALTISAEGCRINIPGILSFRSTKPFPTVLPCLTQFLSIMSQPEQMFAIRRVSPHHCSYIRRCFTATENISYYFRIIFKR